MIADSTRMQAYQLNAGGTRGRMAILRMIAAHSVRNANPSTRLSPNDWKGARSWTLKNWRDAFCAGLHQGENQWYTHTGEYFRRETYAHEILNSRHTGYYTDNDCCELARGIVASLPHGRFLAGYEWSSNGERVWFPDIFDCESEAARAADSHAEKFAESVREDDERFQAMCEAEDEAEALEKPARMAYMARNVSADHREAAREALQALREARETLAARTAEYERG